MIIVEVSYFMKISGKNNNLENQPIKAARSHKSDINYEEKDIANSPNPAEYLGRSQIVFRGRDKLNDKPEKQNSKSFKLVETPILPKEEAIKCLKKYYFSDDDIEKINFDDEKILSQISNLDAFIKTGTVTDEEMSDFEDMMKKYSFAKKKELLEDFQQEAKYANKENLKELQKYIAIESSSDFAEVISFIMNCEGYEGFFNKIHLFSPEGVKMVPDDLDEYKYYTKDDIESITPERIEIINRINEYLPDNHKLLIKSCNDVAKREQYLTPGIIDKYCSNIKELSEKGIVDRASLNFSNNGGTIDEHISKITEIKKMLDEYPMDLESASGAQLSIADLYELSKRDSAEVQTYVNSLSKDAKFDGIKNFIYCKTNIPNDKLSEICNVIYDKDYGRIHGDDKILAYIDENKGENCENIDGIIDLLKAYKGTDGLNTYHPASCLYVANGDYKGAAEAIKNKQEIINKGLYFDDSSLSEVLQDKDTDFESYNAILRYMSDNSLRCYDYPNSIYTDKKGLNKLKLRHFESEKGIFHPKTCSYRYFDKQYKELDDLAECIENDDELAFVKNNLFKSDSDENIIFWIGDVKILLSEYRKNPELLKEVLSEKDSRGGIKYRNVEKSIIPIVEARAIDKDCANYVIALNDFGGHSRFKSSEVKDVVEALKTDKAFTNRLLAEITTYDEHVNPHYYVDKRILKKLNNNEVPDVKSDNGKLSYRHNFDAIKVLVDTHLIAPELTELVLDKYSTGYFNVNDIRTMVIEGQKDKELLNTLMFAKKKDWDDKEKDRFSPEVISNILENLPSDKQFLYDIISETKEDRYSGKQVLKYNQNEIENLCIAAHTDLELTKDLMKETEEYGNEKYDRFNARDIRDLVEVAQNDKTMFYSVLKHKKEQYDGTMTSRYSRDELYRIMYYAPIDKSCMQYLLNINETYKDKNVYEVYDVVDIINAHKEEPEYVDSLLEKRCNNYKGEKVPLFGGSDISRIVSAHKKEPQYTDYLVSQFESNNGDTDLAYNGANIERIVDAYLIDKDYTNELVAQTVRNARGKNIKRFNGGAILSIMNYSKEDKDFVRYVVNDKTIQPNGAEEYTFSQDEVLTLLQANSALGKKGLNAQEYIKELAGIKEPAGQRNVLKLSLQDILKIVENTTFEQYEDLKSKIGDKIGSYNAFDILTAIEFSELYQVQSLNEIPLNRKKDLLRRLVNANVDMFKISDIMHKDFPIIPNNKEEYCEVLPAIVRSLGIETNIISDKQTDEFMVTMAELSDNLSKLSDEEYNKLTFSQEYDKDEFISDVLEKTKNLDSNELQKVYDYFGFELVKNPKNMKTGYSIKGYPVNLNNGKKLADITDENTKVVVEDLRKNVVKFSENNKIKASNKDIEKELNKLVEVLPEIRITIGKTQHASHDFDVFKHSLKVMQKVAQDKDFEKLNESDRKVMLLATLIHDITKAEGYSDGTHPEESAFDSYFIAKKFKLTKDEEIKLYTLIRHHEWLSYVNTQKTPQNRQKAQQSVAFDLQQNNLFDMALMFTHADLKAVKDSDLFHDKTEGNSRLDFNNERRSFGEAADFHAEKIREYIAELKKTQPLLPTTKMPKASDIEKLITTVNPDGSTNIKGVYIKENDDKKRLVVVKFNEVEDSDWEKMGLPKGSSTKGVMATCTDTEEPYDVETGNIKFFVHGLDYSNQLAKFDAFSLLNSDALLSVSYAERPETKFRFFRAQGVMLDVSADYVYGGGNTDAGSGCGKNIEEFKKNYIFGGYREKDRKYISDLVKETTGMSDDEYVKFVEKNKNKPMIAIEPKEVRENIIKAFATINSNHRKGNRAYNEMYLSNPKSVMGVYAYNMADGESIPNPVEFLEKTYHRTNFLQDYAIEHDIPFFLFGE